MPGTLTPPLTAARLVIARDLLLAFRRPEQLVHPLAFFVLVTALFPLSISPERSQLRAIAPGGAVGRRAAGGTAGAGFPVPRRRPGRHLGAICTLGAVPHLAAPGQDGRPLAADRRAAVAGGTAAGLHPGRACNGRRRYHGDRGAREPGPELHRIHRRGADPGCAARWRAALHLDPAAGRPDPDLRQPGHRTGIRGEAYVAPMELLGAIVVLSFTLAPLAAAAAVRISLE